MTTPTRTRSLLWGVALCLGLFAHPAFGAGGEDCASATVIPGLPFFDTGNTCSAVDDYNEACPFTPLGGRDLVYRFTPSADVEVELDLCGSNFDTKVYLYAGSCPLTPGSGAAVACNDDFCGVNGFRSRLQVMLTAGIEYFIVVDGYGASDCGEYDLSVNEFVPLPSDTCALAETITLPFAGAISTTGANDDYNEACPFDTTGAPDVVRHFVASRDGEISIHLCDSAYDTKVYIYEGSCPAPGTAIGAGGSGTAIACNDDACGVNGWRSRIWAVPVTAGEDYFIVFDGYGATDFGDAIVTIEQVPPPGPGESCEEAIEVPSLPFVAVGETQGISRYELPCQFVFENSPERVYRYTAPADEWIRVDLCASDFDTKVAVVAGPCPLPVDLSEGLIECNDDACGDDGTRSQISAVFLAEGEEVFIVVDGHAQSDAGTFTLEITPTCAPDHPSEEVTEIPVGDRPLQVAITPDGTRLFASNYGDATLTVIDTVSDSVVATVPVGSGPYRMVVTPDGARLYVTEYWNSTVGVLDVPSLVTSASLPFGPNPLGIAISPDGTRLYVSSELGSLSVWSLPDHTWIDSITGVPARELIVAPDGATIYGADASNNRVWAIDASSLSATAIPVDSFPQALAFAPDGKHLLVGNFGFDRTPDHLSVIDTKILEVVARVRCGAGPEEIGIIPGTDLAVVTEWGFSHHPNESSEELEYGLGNLTVIRLPNFDWVGDVTNPPMIDSIVDVVTHLGDYTFGVAVHPSGEKVYAANAGYAGPDLADFISVIAFPGGVVTGRFRRGDVNVDGSTDIADGVAILSSLFAGEVLGCENAADVNDDESRDIADAIALLTTLFGGGSSLPGPASCGVDPTPGPVCCDQEGCP